MALVRVSGFRAVRITSYWTPGDTRPTDDELRVLENVRCGARGTACACTSPSCTRDRARRR